MKKKLIIGIAVLIVLACAVLAVILLNRNEKTMLYLGDKEVAVASYKEEDETYISAKDVFREADVAYEVTDNGIRATGSKTLEINTEDGAVKISGENAPYTYKAAKGEIMISPYLAGEIIGGEVAAMNDKIYIIETEPVFVTFRENNRQIEFGYSDNMFAPSSYEYNHALAKMSLGAAVAAFSAKEGDKHWGEDGNFSRDKNIITLYKDMGFENIKTYNYDKSLNSKEDKVAFAIGEKTIKLPDGEYRVIAVSIRGGAYGNEWVSNFNLGSGENHLGFDKAAEEVKEAVIGYAGENRKNTKLWLNGYSRGAAVANLASAKLGDSFDKEHIYAYTFATPKGTAREDKNDDKYGYIFNIISDNDLVPLVAPTQWGYGRFGRDVKFPDLSEYDAAAAEKESKRIGEIYQAISSAGELNLMEIENSNQSNQVKTTVESLCIALDTKENYVKGIAPIMMEFIECGNTKVKDAKGRWQWVSAGEGIKYKFKEEGKNLLLKAEKDGFIKSVQSRLGEIGEQVKAFGAICIKNGRDPYTVITEEIGVTNLITVASIFAPVTGNAGTISKVHYPESYMAMMLGISNPQMLRIE